MTRRLGDIAHARAGDKGDTSILMVAPYDRADFALLMASVTTERVATHFGTTADKVALRPAADLGALTIVLRNQLLGGVTRATTLDPHGKTLSGHLLLLPIPNDAE